MKSEKSLTVSLPVAPSSIEKGKPLKAVLGKTAVEFIGERIAATSSDFNLKEYRRMALTGLSSLELKPRAVHIAKALHAALPARYETALEILLASWAPIRTDVSGLATFVYLPHSSFIEMFGVDPRYNENRDPFPASMRAMYELTKRFTAEFAIRPFILKDSDRVLRQMKRWIGDSNHHVRRLCSEGLRPRLPWGLRIPAFIKDPSPLFPILEALKDDEEIYVRRSVANHVGDIAKDHLSLALDILDSWLADASEQRRWVIRHALRYPDKKGNKRARRLRAQAGLRS